MNIGTYGSRGVKYQSPIRGKVEWLNSKQKEPHLKQYQSPIRGKVAIKEIKQVSPHIWYQSPIRGKVDFSNKNKDHRL